MICNFKCRIDYINCLNKKIIIYINIYILNISIILCKTDLFSLAIEINSLKINIIFSNIFYKKMLF